MVSILYVMIVIECKHSKKNCEKLNNAALNDFSDFPQ